MMRRIWLSLLSTKEAWKLYSRMFREVFNLFKLKLVQFVQPSPYFVAIEAHKCLYLEKPSGLFKMILIVLLAKQC